MKLRSAQGLFGIGLEGCTSGVTAGGCVGGAYGDLTGGATGLAVMICAVLYVAADALDVITALLVVHKSIPSFDFRGLAALLLFSDRWVTIQKNLKGKVYYVDLRDRRPASLHQSSHK